MRWVLWCVQCHKEERLIASKVEGSTAQVCGHGRWRSNPGSVSTQNGFIGSGASRRENTTVWTVLPLATFLSFPGRTLPSKASSSPNCNLQHRRRPPTMLSTGANSETEPCARTKDAAHRALSDRLPTACRWSSALAPSHNQRDKAAHQFLDPCLPYHPPPLLHRAHASSCQQGMRKTERLHFQNLPHAFLKQK